MLAPPGYANMVSTPSRSSAATRISLPDIAGPISAFFFCTVFFCVIILVRVFGRSRRHKKTHSRFSSRGFLSKVCLRSTSANGAANYDDDQQTFNLSNS